MKKVRKAVAGVAAPNIAEAQAKATKEVDNMLKSRPLHIGALGNEQFELAMGAIRTLALNAWASGYMERDLEVRPMREVDE